MNNIIQNKILSLFETKLPYDVILKVISYLQKCYKCKVYIFDKNIIECNECQIISCKKCVKTCFDCDKNMCKKCIKKIVLNSLDSIKVCKSCIQNSICKLCKEYSNERCNECNINLCRYCSSSCCDDFIVYCTKCVDNRFCDINVCDECNINNICNDCCYSCYGCSKGICGECNDIILAYHEIRYCLECRDNF